MSFLSGGMDSFLSAGSNFLSSNFGSILQGVSGIGLIGEGGQTAANGAAYAGALATAGGQFSAALDVQGAAFANQLAVQGGQIGAEYALLGGQLDATQYQLAGAAAVAEANYNQALTKFNTNRQFDAMSRQITQVMSNNQAIQGASGLSMGSHSFLAVAHTTLSQYERQVAQLNNNATIQMAQQKYAGDVQNVQAQNQANLALYEGQTTATLDKYNAAVTGAVATYQGQAAAQSATYNAEVVNQERKYQGEVAQYQADSAKYSDIAKGVGSLLSSL